MNAVLDELVVVGLNRAEALDFKRHQANRGGAHLEEKPVDPDQVGVIDPVTWVVVPVAVVAIQGLIAWLLKNRSSEVIDVTTIIRHPDGTTEERTLHVDRKSADSSDYAEEFFRTLRVPSSPS